MATDPSSLIQSLLGGGAAIPQAFTQGQQDQQQQVQNQQNQQLNTLKIQQAVQAQQQAAAQAQQDASYQQEASAWAKNGATTDGLAQLAIKYPDQYKTLKSVWDTKNDDQTQSHVNAIAPAYAALSGDKPDYDTAISVLQPIADAARNAGKPDAQIEGEIQKLQSRDPDQAKEVAGLIKANIAVSGGDSPIAKAFSEQLAKANASDNYTIQDGYRLNKQTGETQQLGSKPEYQWDETRGAFFLKPGTGGGGLASSGTGAAGSTGDVSRLINSNAGGGYVPPSVQTLGQFVQFGKGLNAQGAKSSSAGTYQINGSTMAQFAPKVLGPDWQSAPFNADSQEKVGEAIFDWSKQQSNPAAALRSRWVSLSPSAASQLVKGDWSQARGVIAQGETGGAPGSSASAPGAGGYPQVVQVADPKTPGGGQAPSPIPDGLNGPQAMTYLQKTNPSLASRVQAVLDTRAPLPATSTRNPINNAIAAAVNQIDPTFDQQAWKRRAETVQQYSPGGKVGQQLLSAKTSIDHLYDMAQSAQSLPDHYFGFMNAAANGTTANGSQAGQNLIRYNEGRKIVSTELAKFLTGKAPAEGEIKQNYDSYDPSKGATGIKTALTTDIDYLSGKLQPLVQAFKDNTGKDFNIDAQIPGGAVNAKLAALNYYRSSGNLPTVVSSPVQAAKLPSGSVFVTPDGQVRTKH